MSIDLEAFSYEELAALNHAIVERLKFLDSVYAFQEMTSLGMGAKVSFESKVGRQMATIVKFNTKTVGVLTESGRRWNVSPHLLSLIKEVQPNNPMININKNKNRKNRGKRKK